MKGASTVTITRNEMLYAFNQGDKFVLAIVLVGEDDAVDGPHYIRNPFDREPGWGVASINFNLGDLLARAEADDYDSSGDCTEKADRSRAAVGRNQRGLRVREKCPGLGRILVASALVVGATTLQLRVQ